MDLFSESTRIDFSNVAFNELRVMKAERGEIEKFVEQNHYSGCINGVTTDYCFALRHGEATLGACMYGRMAMAGQC